jgi:DNA replication protein DnaC
MAEAVCPLCRGVGFRIHERDGISAAQPCDCRGAARQRSVLENSNIPPNYTNASVDNFVLPRDNPAGRSAMADVLIGVRNYAKDYPVLDKPGLLFIGNPGTGKTHLAVAALRQLIGRGFEGIFFDYQNLLERIRSGYDQISGASNREAYQIALDTEVLLLDDLGAHRVTDWVEDTITSIITYRCNNRKALIATTNLRDPEAGDRRTTGLESDIQSKYFLEERVGMRARSRLFEMCRVIRMPGVEDYRMRRR